MFKSLTFCYVLNLSHIHKSFDFINVSHFEKYKLTTYFIILIGFWGPSTVIELNRYLDDVCVRNWNQQLMTFPKSTQALYTIEIKLNIYKCVGLHSVEEAFMLEILAVQI